MAGLGELGEEAKNVVERGRREESREEREGSEPNGVE